MAQHTDTFSSTGRTRARLQEAALALFERQGYDATTVEDIARAVGVSHMTFFRHFPTKESVVLDDPFDPALAAAVTAQPDDLPAMTRVCAGLRAALGELELPDMEQIRSRVRIVASTASLEAGMWRNTMQSQRVIAQALVRDGVGALAAGAAAGAAMGALTVTLLDWGLAPGDGPGLAELLVAALDTIDPARG